MDKYLYLIGTKPTANCDLCDDRKEMIKFTFSTHLLSHICVSRYKIIHTASHCCCILSLGFNLFYQISWTGNVYTQVVKFQLLK